MTPAGLKETGYNTVLKLLLTSGRQPAAAVLGHRAHVCPEQAILLTRWNRVATQARPWQER